MRTVVPMNGKLLDVLLPTAYMPEMRDGTVNLVPQVLTHGHVMVQARMSGWLQQTLANLPDVFGFLGRDNPAPLTDDQVKVLLDLQQKGRQMPMYLQGACVGDWFEILEGAHARQRGRLVGVRSGMLGVS